MTDNIIIEIKPIDKMRYATVGDYFENENVLKFEIADTGNKFFNRCILIHELIEQTLTEFNGVKEDVIMQHDLEFEANRKENDFSEPGFANNSPYLKEHSFATSVELGMFAMTGQNWDQYNEVINSL